MGARELTVIFSFPSPHRGRAVVGVTRCIIWVTGTGDSYVESQELCSTVSPGDSRLANPQYRRSSPLSHCPGIQSEVSLSHTWSATQRAASHSRRSMDSGSKDQPRGPGSLRKWSHNSRIRYGNRRGERHYLRRFGSLDCLYL